ncbi:transposase [Methylosarcina fibrata]|uniref:transposase n=1 Tax=Methylosarcina fibrata TaxID=105972 RepID=UPI00037575F7|nr:transposase [Methylosarcina fibrata]
MVTNLERPAALYDELYCRCGKAENRIKEALPDLFGTRASCHTFLANWLRLLLNDEASLPNCPCFPASSENPVNRSE